MQSISNSGIHVLVYSDYWQDTQVRESLFTVHTKATSSLLFHFTQHNNFAKVSGKCSRQSILQQQLCDSYSSTSYQQKSELDQ